MIVREQLDTACHLLQLHPNCVEESSMSAPKYIFTDTSYVSELKRLQAIERVFDPASRRQILAAGLTEAWHCLEIGAGAGSIAQWLAQVVGDRGEVVAVDLDTRFIADIKLPNLKILEADIRSVPLVEDSFDLIHARYVLIHLPDFEAVLSKLLALLKPGGAIVLEEPDFSVAKAIVGDPTACESFAKIHRAIAKIYANKGIDFDLGIKLPSICQTLGLKHSCLENHVPISKGGSELALMMKMSAMQLAEQYMATGEVSQTDIENYYEFTENPNAWAIYYATVRITGKK
jgi:SAM-dependent methyltransferase